MRGTKKGIDNTAGASPKQPYALCGATVFDGEQFLSNHCVVVQEGKIIDVLPHTTLPENITQIALEQGILAPGFIDLQVNGGGDVMLNHTPRKDTVDTMTTAHRHSGTTGMLPTIISDTRDNQQACIRAVQAAQVAGNRSVLGIHIEGPFFEISKRGAHKASMIRSLEAEDINWLSSIEMSSILITLAPEHTKAGQIKQLTDAGVLVWAGHTGARYEQIQEAIAEGLCGFTHLFNAMQPLSGRDPGTVGAALDSKSTWVGIIADGHHVHPANIRIVHKLKPTGKTLLVSDAMATVGGVKASFEIYGEKIEKKQGRLLNGEGVLAGSAIGMIDAVRFATEVVNIPLQESLRMASLYPAQLLQRADELGRIASGFRADLVHFDSNYKVQCTWVAGDPGAFGNNSPLINTGE